MSQTESTPDRGPRQQRLGLSWTLGSAAAQNEPTPAPEAVLEPAAAKQNVSLEEAIKTEEPAMENQTPDVTPEPQLKIKLEKPEPQVDAVETPAEIPKPKLRLTQEPADAEEPDTQIVTNTRAPDAEPAAAPEATPIEEPDDNGTIILDKRPDPVAATPKTDRLETAAAAPADSLGGKLAEARESRGLSIAQVAEDTRISADYIKALEAEDFDNLPLAAIYVKSYLKTLARRYGLPHEELVAEYEARMADPRPAAAREEPAADASPAGDAPAAADKPQAKGKEKAKEKKPKRRKKASHPVKSERNLKRYSLAMAAVVALVFVILGAAVIKSRVFGNIEVSGQDLTLITEDDLESYVAPEVLPFSAMEIPRKQNAADAR